MFVFEYDWWIVVNLLVEGLVRGGFFFVVLVGLGSEGIELEVLYIIWEVEGIMVVIVRLVLLE